MTPEELVTKLAETLRAGVAVPADRRLWSIATIAEYTGFSVSTVAQRHVCRPDFPDAIRVDAGAAPRWPAREVIDWYEGKRATPAARQ